MNLLESFRVAWGGLSGNKLRSVLTMLGVIIGVGAVITLVALGEGSSRQVTEQIQGLGSNLITIFARGAGARLYVEDADSLVRRVPALSNAIPMLSRNPITVKWNNVTYDTTIDGTGDAYPVVRNHPVAAGMFFSAEDVSERRKVAVIGDKVRAELFGERNPMGQTLLIQGQVFTVIGVLAPKGQGTGQDFDDRVVIPVKTAQRLFGTDRVGSILAQARTAEEAPAAVARIQAIYRVKFPPRTGTQDSVNVFSQDQLLSALGSVFQTFTLLLGGVAGVSLLVGGIGIMNIMLVSVTERTREIGIRKALGAKQRDILAQFLVESVILSITGGLIGIGFGIGAARTATALNLRADVSPGAVLLAFSFAFAIGLFFGIYPAMKAARLDPIVALRYD